MTSIILKMTNQIRLEFPYLSDNFVAALEAVSQKKMVVPSIELDREIHAVCLVSLIYLRLNAIMCEAVGFGFVHRPACDMNDDDNISVKMPKLSMEDSQEAKDHYFLILPEMVRLEGIDSPIVERRAPVGHYAVN